jgi:hypothetical protein
VAGDEDKGQAPSSVGDRFPALKQLEENVERAKLEQSLAEARAKTTTAKLPDLDVELARDSVTVSDKTTGLASVLVQMDAIALADDIADIALDAARRAATGDGATSRTYNIRVVTDPAGLGGVDVYRMLEGELKELNQRLDRVAPAKRPDKEETRGIMEFAGAAAAVGLGVQLIGLASKLFARDYQVSGREVAVGDLGIDLQVAHYLSAKKKSDETVNVEVERVRQTPTGSKIVEEVRKLAISGEARLAPLVNRAAQALAEKRSSAETDKASITPLNAEILKLTERVHATEPAKDKPEADGLTALLGELTDRRKHLEAGLPGRERELADALHGYEQITALVSDIEDFLTAALTPSADRRRAPVFEAARVEKLVAEVPDKAMTEYVLFVRLVAGGIDQTIETKLGPDRVTMLAGASAEFALIGREGRLLASGVRPALQASTMKLDDPDSFHQRRPAYVPQDRSRTTNAARAATPYDGPPPDAAAPIKKGLARRLLRR